jgi:hypothetical protein
MDSVIEELGGALARDSSCRQALQGTRHIAPGFVEATLPILSEIGEHREQHEATHEGQRVVGVEGLETSVHGAGICNAAMPIHRAGSDVLDALKQRLTPIGANHIAEELAEIANIRVLGDRLGCGLHRHSCYADRDPSEYAKNRPSAVS